MRTPLLLASLALVAACGGSTPPTPPATPPTPETPAAPATPPPTTAVTSTEDAGATASATDAGAPPATAAPTPKSWDDLSHDEKLALMKNQVLPKMKEAFQAYDSKDFADFTCVTCHGPDAKKGKFDMPNPKLPKLDFKAGLKKAMAKHPKMVKFMHETVVPQMATMLGEQPYDPATGKGFGCAECHTSSD